MSDQQQQAAVQGGDADQSAVQSQQQASQQQSVQPQEITEAYLNELREQGRHEELRNAVDQLERQAQGLDPIPQNQDAGQSPDGNGQGAQQQGQKKSFDIKFRGEDVSFSDDDGYLGAGDFGKMKKELAHNRAKLGDVEEQLSRHTGNYEQQIQRNRSLNEQKEALEGEVNKLRGRVSELEKELESAKTQQPKQPPQPAFDIPEPPAMPKLSSDMRDWNDEETESFNKYQESKSEYDKKVAALLRGIATGEIAPPRKEQPSPKTQQHAAQPELSGELKEAVEFYRQAKQSKASETVSAQQKAYWDSFREFQGKHSEFNTPVDIETLNTQVLDWMNKLAYANGIDLKPGATAEEKANYERAKRQLAYKYASGDAQVIANSEGSPAPQGYDVYVKLANLDKIRKDLISRGVLGQQAGMQEAWLQHYSGTGMGNDIQNLEASAAQRGASGVLNAMQNHQQQFAQNIPNNAGGGGGAPPAPQQSGNFTSDEVNQLLRMTPTELMSNPQLAERRKQVLEALGQQ